MISFIIGLICFVAGGCVGLLTFALLSANRGEDDEE